MERVIYTGLPECLHRQTMYDWGRRGIRSRSGRKFRGSNGRLRCFFDTTWLSELERIEARSGQSQLLRTISRMTPEWIAVARKRGKFWSVSHYLVPQIVASAARELLKDKHVEEVPF